MTADFTKYFEFTDAKSSKFWEITKQDRQVIVRYGKIGTNGQTQAKEFPDAASATKHAEKLMAEKMGKGYAAQASAQAAGSAPTATVSGKSQSAPAVSARSPINESPPAKSAPKLKKVTAPVAEPRSAEHDPEASPDQLLPLLDKDEKTNRLLARHPKASAELLEKLAHSSDKTTRQGVTSNPNAAPETLARLGQQFPKEFLANPALELLLMVNPALMEEVPEALLVRLLKQADCPTSLLTWASGHPQSKVQLAVAMNAKATAQALGKLRASQHQAVLEAVKAPTNEIDTTQDPEAVFRKAVEERLGALTPAEAQIAWEQGDVGLPQWPYLPLLFRWEKSDLVDPDFPEEGWLAHPNVPVSILKVLSESRNPNVLNLVKTHPNTPGRVLEARSAQHSLNAEKSASRGDVAAAALGSADQSNSVQGFERSANASSPKCLHELLLGDVTERIRVAGLSDTPQDFLDTLSRDKSVSVRSAVGANPNAPPSTLDRLSIDENGHVRAVVAANECASPTLIDSMVHEKQIEWVLAAVEAREGLAPRLAARVRQLARRGRWYKSEIRDATSSVRKAAERDDVLHVCAPEPAKAVLSTRAIAPLMALCSGPFIEPSRIAKIVGSSDWLVRAAAARNPGTPDNLLKKLKGDADSRVCALTTREPITKETGTKSLGVPRARLDRIAREVALEFDTDLLNNVFGDPLWRHFSSVYNLWLYLASPALVELRSILGEALWMLLWEEGANVEYAWHHRFFHGGSFRKFIAGHEACPTTVLEHLFRSDDPDALVALVCNPSATDHLKSSAMERLAEMTRSEMPGRWKIAENSDTPPEILESLTVGAINANADDEVLIGIARNPNVPAQTLGVLARRAECAKYVAANPGVSSETIEFLSERWPSDYILEGFAANPDPQLMLLAFGKMAKSSKLLRQSFEVKFGAHSLASVLENLALSGSSTLRRTIAKNPCTPAAVLQILAGHKDEATREEVAANPCTPALTLGSLAADESDSVRQNLAKNPQTPAPILERLASDANQLVRCCISTNPNRSLPPEAILAEIARDYLKRLQQKQRGGIEVPPPLTQQDLLRALIWLRRVPESVDNKTLTRLAHCEDWLSRLGVALHPQASAGQLKLLAKDTNSNVAAVAGHRAAA